MTYDDGGLLLSYNTTSYDTSYGKVYILFTVYPLLYTI